MSQRSILFSVLTVLTILNESTVFGAAPVVIQLAPYSVVDREVIRLNDVSSLQQVTKTNLTTDLLNIDLCKFESDQEQMIIERSLVDIRLQLAGKLPSEYRLVGPEYILISRSRILPQPVHSIELVSNEERQMPVPQQLTDLDVEHAIQTTLMTQFHIPEEDIKVLLMQSVMGSFGSADSPDATRLEVLTPNVFPLGRTSITLRFWKDDQLVKTKIAPVEISRRQTLLLTTKTIARNEILQADHIRQEVQYVDARHDMLTAKEVVGTKVKRTLQPGQILNSQDLVEAQPEAAEIIIKARDSVRVVAYRKGLQFVIPAAEALESGRKGQIIRVRNIESNRNITGRVVDRGEVEVVLE